MGSLADVNYMPLSGAYLCADVIRYQDQEGNWLERPCNTVGNQAGQCPACGSRHGLMSLAGLLNRPEPTAAEISHQEGQEAQDIDHQAP